jgi:endonuclease YncB( thermonuclease family)
MRIDKLMRLFNRSLFFVLLFLSLALVSLAADTFTGKVVGVSDGDIISVMRGGRAVKVRLHGIDCPGPRTGMGALSGKSFSRMV